MTQNNPKDPPSAFAGFAQYTKWVRPTLESAFRRRLTSLLGGIALTDDVSFHAALAGGKMIRGCLLCLMTQCLGGALEAAIPRAVAIELIQAASLLHDDFVDQDSVRRNEPATWTLEGARRAVLLGDLIFASTIKVMNDLRREDGSILSGAIARMAEGAIREPIHPLSLAVEIAAKRFDGDLYEKIIYLKTGNLFGAACRLAAIAAGADAEFAEKSERYGLRIGEAYQIADDLQDMERYLKAGSISVRQMAELAPACFYFVKDGGFDLGSFLRKEQDIPSDRFRKCFETAAHRMKDEMACRIQSALREIETGFPRNEFTQLARQAPRDLIKIFNESDGGCVGERLNVKS